MLKEVEEYIAALSTALIERDEKVSQARAEYDPIRSTMSYQDLRYEEAARKYNDATCEAYDAYDVVEKAAWEAMGSSDDAVVRFIVQNCFGYRSDAEHILRALPTSNIEDLYAVSREHDFCGVFGQFAQRAIQEGVIKDDRPRALVTLEEFLHDEADLTEYERKTIERLAGELVDELRAERTQAA